VKRIALILVLLGGAAVSAQTTKPASRPAGELEMRAIQAFNRGEYAIAIPLLKKTAEALKDQPDRLGSIQEMIRVAEDNVDESPATPARSLSEGRKPHPAPEAGKVLELNIKELGNFDYDAEKGGNIPADVKKLSGSTIRVTGFMMPMEQAERVTRFALLPSLAACCFGEPAQIQHSIVVTCPPGKAVTYFPDEITVEGVLSVEEKKDDGIIISIFQMKTNSVKPAVK
jgi:hypothetical protein